MEAAAAEVGSRTDCMHGESMDHTQEHTKEHALEGSARDCGGLSSVFEGHLGQGGARYRITLCVLWGLRGCLQGIAGKDEPCPGLRKDGGQDEEERGEGMRGAYSTPPPKKSAARAARGAKQRPTMRATQSRAGPTPAEEVKEVGGDHFLAVSQPMDVVLEPSPSKIAVVSGGRKKKAQGVAEPLSSKKVQGLKIATLANHDAPLSNVPREPCQDSTLKKAPKEAQPPNKGPSALKAQKSAQSKEESGTAGTRPGAPKPPKEDNWQGAPKPPKDDNRTKQDLIMLEGSKEWSSKGGERHSGLQATQDTVVLAVNKRKFKANVKEKEGTAVLEQHNFNRLKKMIEVAFERKLAIDEVKVKEHTGKGQLEKVLKDRISLQRDGMKKKSKHHVEKGLEDKGPADKALALVGSSK
ncbi:hypothetical protein L7F22_061093 [Adiantum nelumboides]|nr:hypothetical protein [Adiantum nelumboides]